MKQFLSLININFLLISINFLCLVECEPDTDPCGEGKCSSNRISCSSIETDSCDPKCKPKYGDSKCYYCEEDYPYYYIESGVCSNRCVGSNVIFHNDIDSKECINQNLNDIFYMGNAYYFNYLDSCPEFSSPLHPGSKECKCDNYYYIEEVSESIKIYHCLGPDVIPENYYYYNYETNQLYENTCPNNYKIIKPVIISGKEVKRCYNGCLDGEFYKRFPEVSATLVFEAFCVD